MNPSKPVYVPGRRKCVRCHGPIDNIFRKDPWCLDCELDLKSMKFDGEDVLKLVLTIMPPTPPHPDMLIKVWAVLRTARRVLLDKELLLPNDNEPPDQKLPPQSKIIT